jgi:hypothetical protein
MKNNYNGSEKQPKIQKVHLIKKPDFMKRLFVVLFFTNLILFFACETENTVNKVLNVDGKGTLKGTIGLYEGNCMPSPGFPSCQPSPISTTIAITNPSEEFNMKLLIDSLITSEEGTFEIELPEGTYSLFIRDGSEFICDSWSCSDKCYCTHFKITSDSLTLITANIDHAAW